MITANVRVDDLKAILAAEHPAVVPGTAAWVSYCRLIASGMTATTTRPALTSLGGSKIDAIKAIRAATGCGLKEAKDYSERSLPIFIDEDWKCPGTGVTVPADADGSLAAKLRLAGATVQEIE